MAIPSALPWSSLVNDGAASFMCSKDFRAAVARAPGPRLPPGIVPRLDARESAISMDLESLEKQKKELKQIREDLASRLADFEARQGQDLSEEQLKEYKDTSKRWIEMGPEVASVEIQNWRQKRRFEEALTIFELLKAEEKAPIIAFMLTPC